MIATGAIHITMDVTANCVITPDIASLLLIDGDDEINVYRYPQFSQSAKNRVVNCLHAHIKQATPR